MIRRPPISTLTDTPCPFTPLFRSAVELLDAVVGAERGVVVGDDGRQRRLLAFWVLPVVGLFLRQVFLQLLHIGADIGRRGEHRSDIERSEERRVGKEGGSPCRTRWWSYH